MLSLAEFKSIKTIIFFSFSVNSIIFMAPNVPYKCANPDINDTCSAECTEYAFNRTIFTETIQMTWELVCSKKHLANASQTIFMFGILVGNMVFGTLADK